MAAPNPTNAGPAESLPIVDIRPLLSRLWPLHPEVTADEISDAIAYFFTGQVSEAQASALLICLHFTGWDRQAEVLAGTAGKMMKAAARIDAEQLRKVVETRGRPEGLYRGGLVC